MPDRVVSFGLTFADPDIPWPKRGSGDRCLCARSGWTLQTIPVMRRGKSETMDAMVRGDLAVNVMLEGEGIAICLAASGWRISYNGAVFAKCVDAMIAAETMAMSNDKWNQIPDAGWSEDQRLIMKRIVG
jgi:hypothetical protein